jgi:hypothetical protein
MLFNAPRSTAVPHFHHSRDKFAGADLNSLRLARRAEYMDVLCNLIMFVFEHIQGLKRYPLSRV